MDRNRYIEKLNNLITNNTMINYEDMYSDFIFVYYSLISEQNLKIVVRGDYINAELLWHIRYLKSKNVNPIFCLTIEENVKQYKEILGIPMITISDLNDADTSNMMLLVVNRKSDFMNVTDDYREASFLQSDKGQEWGSIENVEQKISFLYIWRKIDIIIHYKY